ncbi:MAG: hypothetical protein NTX79_03820 [Candidatus Micrarchaeota archaeon]|nr:hypothetical protein [Candidatus Micrarchaeota archaeon]
MVFAELNNNTKTTKAVINEAPVIESPVQKVSTAVTETNTNRKLVKALQASGFENIKINYKDKDRKDVSQPPPNSFVDLAGFNKLKEFTITANMKDENGNVHNCNIKIANGFAMVDDGGSQLVVSKGSNASSRELFNYIDKQEKMGNLSKSDVNKIKTEYVEKNTLSCLDEYLQTDAKFLYSFNQQNIPDNNTRNKADQLVRDGKKKEYLELIDSLGLHEKFIDFLNREIQNKAGAGAVSPSDLQTSFVQQGVLSAQVNSDLNLVQDREKDAVKKGGGDTA